MPNANFPFLLGEQGRTGNEVDCISKDGLQLNIPDSEGEKKRQIFQLLSLVKEEHENGDKMLFS